MIVRLFARARELAGSGTIVIELPPGATVCNLRQKIVAACPALESLLARSAIAVNDEFANDDVAVPLDAEVALLPPVSGG